MRVILIWRTSRRKSLGTPPSPFQTGPRRDRSRIELFRKELHLKRRKRMSCFVKGFQAKLLLLDEDPASLYHRLAVDL